MIDPVLTSLDQLIYKLKLLFIFMNQVTLGGSQLYWAFPSRKGSQDKLNSYVGHILAKG